MVSIGRSNPSPNAVSLNEVGFYGQGPDGYGWSIGYNAKTDSLPAIFRKERINLGLQLPILFHGAPKLKGQA